MKKILAIAVAAAISAPAMADLTVGGSAGLNIGQDADNNWGLGMEDFEVTFAASQTFDSTTISASSAIALTSGEDEVGKNSQVTVAGTFGTLQVAKITAGADFGVDTMLDQIGGADNGDADSHESITYTLPTMMEGVTVAINYLEANDNTGAATNNTFDNVEYRVTTSVAGLDLHARYRPEDNRIRTSVATTAGAVSAALGYQSEEGGASRTSVALGYAMSEAASISASFATDDEGGNADATSGFELDYDMDLGSNVALNVGYDNVEGEVATGASLTFAF